MTDFKDPPNKDEILRNLSTLKTADETEKFINDNFPGWLILSLPGYSSDYHHLQKNWEKICQMAKTVPQKIILVSDIKFDDTHIATSVISEFMTRNGYCVRRAAEFIACPKCEGAIPSRELWIMLKDRGMPVPKIWANCCSNC
jgi:hypothetical protein